MLKTARAATKITSGGAEGADYVWCTEAIRRNFDVTLMSFAGHRCNAVEGAAVRILTEETLAETDDQLGRVASALRRKLPQPGYVRNLLRRNMHIVRGADAVFAIGELEEHQVAGGTAWGCYYHLLFSREPCLYVFDMKSNRWMRRRQLLWVQEDPPAITAFASCALIGSRGLSREGRNAIVELLEK
jgi:hypothetical protein